MNREELFWAKVDKGRPCWLWTGATSADGYGRFYIGSRRVTGAHRYAYETTFGPIPAGMHLDHLCRVPACVNPAHLEVVTPAVNILRGIGPTAIHARQSRCKHGHEFTPDNTYVNQGSRYCRACHRVRSREYLTRLRESA